MSSEQIPPVSVDDKSIAGSLPDEIVALIMAVAGKKKDPSIKTDITTEEIANLLPSKEVVNAVLAANGERNASPTNELDQARAWIKNQRELQTKAMMLEKQLQEFAPFGKEQAVKGEIPEWVTESWATRLIHKWSAGLSDAVEDAEAYLFSKMNGGNDVRE